MMWFLFENILWSKIYVFWNSKKENELILKEDKNMLGCFIVIKLLMVSNLNFVWEDVRKINLILWLIKLLLCVECEFVF